MKALIFILASVVLSGCATPAYRAVKQECTPAAFADYPLNQVEVVQTRQRLVHVWTGLRNCYTTREGARSQTFCNDVTRPELLHYQERVVIDQNEEVRNMAIASCAANLCVQRYGNSACKTDQLLVPVQ